MIMILSAKNVSLSSPLFSCSENSASYDSSLVWIMNNDEHLFPLFNYSSHGNSANPPALRCSSPAILYCSTQFPKLWHDSWRLHQHWDSFQRTISSRSISSLWRMSLWSLGLMSQGTGHLKCICSPGTPSWNEPSPRLMVFPQDFRKWLTGGRKSLGRERNSRLWPSWWNCVQNCSKKKGLV